MRVRIAAMGRGRGAPETALAASWLARARGAGRSLGFEGFEIEELTPPQVSDAERKVREAGLLLGRVPDRAVLIGLDERGEDLRSASFAARLAGLRDRGSPELVFAIGGADGHGQDLLDRADHRLAFGRATWPHLLVRAMLAEQLYRAVAILGGHPYHRA